VLRGATGEAGRRYAAAWAVMLVLASCQNVADQTATPEPVVAEPGYPSLHTVPPRPQLSYPVEQRRAIVDGLIADREHARYTSQVIRYRTGLSTMPPPEPERVAEAPPEAAPETGDRARAAPAPTSSAPPEVEPRNETIYEDDDLDSFMEDMLDDQAAVDGNPRTEPGGGAAETTALLADALVRPAGAPSAHARDPDSAATSGAQARTPPPPAPAKPSAPPIRTAELPTSAPPKVSVTDVDRVGSLPPLHPVPQGAQIAVADGLVAIDLAPVDEATLAMGSIAFDPGSATLPAGARPALKQWLSEANDQGARVKIVAEGAAPALALDRARAVGLALVQGGLPADRLELSHTDGPGGDRARVFLASP
jgi:outer membrane protein OmpA-like peptidoglycan-associated protein